jgi:hypothetical protein
LVGDPRQLPPIGAGRPFVDIVSELAPEGVDAKFFEIVDRAVLSLKDAGSLSFFDRVFETGGTSLADGMRNLMNDIRQGRLSMVDESAFTPGRNLALTPGKVGDQARWKLVDGLVYLAFGAVRRIRAAPGNGQRHASPARGRAGQLRA